MINLLYLHAGAELYGADIVLLNLIKNLDKSKFKPYVILPSDGPLVHKLQEENITVSVIDYPILRRKYFNIRGIIMYIRRLVACINIINQYCKDNNIEIIHSNTSSVLEGIFLRRKLKIKHIWHIHEIIVKPKIVQKILSYLISTYADYVVTVSNAAKNHLLKSRSFKNKDISVIYNGVDNKKFNPHNEYDYIKKEYGINTDDIVVGMIGRVNSWKGQKHFVEALNNILRNNLKVKGVLVGGVFEGEEWRMEELKALVNDSPYSKQIIVDEYREDTNNLHCMFDIFVLPSTTPDPLPTVVLEAMASGKPIVAYRHGGVTEMVKESYNGLFASVCDYIDLSNKISYLIKNNELRKNMGNNSYKRQVENFSISSYVLNFEHLYEEAVREIK